jgi:hypothetical protein
MAPRPRDFWPESDRCRSHFRREEGSHWHSHPRDQEPVCLLGRCLAIAVYRHYARRPNFVRAATQPARSQPEMADESDSRHGELAPQDWGFSAACSPRWHRLGRRSSSTDRTPDRDERLYQGFPAMALPAQFGKSGQNTGVLQSYLRATDLRSDEIVSLARRQDGLRACSVFDLALPRAGVTIVAGIVGSRGGWCGKSEWVDREHSLLHREATRQQA